MSFGCASAWYEYGNALLVKEEDSPSDSLLNGNEKVDGQTNDEQGEDQDEKNEVSDDDVYR